jgi:hypothetical protein
MGPAGRRNALGKNFNLYLLIVVLSILAIGVIASLWADRRSGNALPRDAHSS